MKNSKSKHFLNNEKENDLKDVFVALSNSQMKGVLGGGLDSLFGDLSSYRRSYLKTVYTESTYVRHN